VAAAFVANLSMLTRAAIGLTLAATTRLPREKQS
jgi:hypothetical protein